jgi:signal transduction histidine kinase
MALFDTYLDPLYGLAQLGTLSLNHNAFRRALLNLIHNAMDAMPQGGSLTFHGQRETTRLQLAVRDTGSGIPTEHLPHIFEPLHTTKPGGTGLGLYIVREIVAAHGGRVTVQSRVGHGTTMTMTSPLLIADRILRRALDAVAAGAQPCDVRCQGGTRQGMAVVPPSRVWPVTVVGQNRGTA